MAGFATRSRFAGPRLLLRGGEHHPKAAHLAPLVARGARTVPADPSEPDSLGTALAVAGKAQGVGRIFPSDLAVDFSAIPVEDHLFLGWRKLARAAIADTGLTLTNTFIGAFTEMLRQPFFGLVDWDRAVVTHWGEADQPYDFTTTDDTARVVAATALVTPVDGPLRFAGETRSPAEIAAIESVCVSPVTSHPVPVATRLRLRHQRCSGRGPPPERFHSPQRPGGRSGTAG